MAVAASACVLAGATWACGDAATAVQAEAKVKKGEAFIGANGKQAGYAETAKRDSKDFHDRDLYLAVNLDGTIVCGGVCK